MILKYILNTSQSKTENLFNMIFIKYNTKLTILVQSFSWECGRISLLTIK